MEAAGKGKKKSDFHIVDSLLSGLIVLYATYLIQNYTENKALLCVLFLLLAFESALRVAYGRRTKVQRICTMVLYAAGAGLILLLNPFHASLLGASCVEFLVMLFNRVMAILKRPKVRLILLNILCILVILALAFVFFGSDMIMARSMKMNEAELQEQPDYAEIAKTVENLESSPSVGTGSGLDMILYIFLMLFVLLSMIVHVVGITISQMKLNILLNIIRETYVMEILLGLLLMIIACSTVFSTLERGMSDYGDALWYSFALVTTIGFGDITAVTPVGRILSVFLGIYGIVVVAIITSVIVNFYGEMRRISEGKTDAEGKNDLPEQEERPDSEE